MDSEHLFRSSALELIMFNLLFLCKCPHRFKQVCVPFQTDFFTHKDEAVFALTIFIQLTA